MDSDLAHLFPNLAAQLENWDGQQPQGDGHDDPSHHGVTDEDVESYLTQRGSLRAPLSPLVSGQQTPATPEFYNNGRAVPPGGDATVEPPQFEPPEPRAEGDSTGEPPPPVAASPVAPPPSDYVQVGDKRYDIRQAQAWAEFDTELAGDPELRQIITEHLQRKRSGIQPQQHQTAPVAPQPVLPDLPPEYAHDETIKAMHDTLRAQQEALARVDRQAQYAAETATAQVQRTYTDIAQGAISEFQKAKGLDDATMAKVSNAAQATGFAAKYMGGVDPLTGVPVTPDPYKAVSVALEAGYYLVPDTRQVEADQEIQRRAAQAKADAERKQKLAGVSGAAGSVPRTQPVPSNPHDSRAAMVQDVAAMLNGSWQGDGS